MKFLHLSDLHLGKQMNDVSLLADQEAVLLGQVVPIARRAKPFPKSLRKRARRAFAHAKRRRLSAHWRGRLA